MMKNDIFYIKTKKIIFILKYTIHRSTGCIMYELCYLKMAYFDKKKENLLRLILNEEQMPQIELSNKFKSIFNKIFVFEFKSRARSDEILAVNIYIFNYFKQVKIILLEFEIFQAFYYIYYAFF